MNKNRHYIQPISPIYNKIFSQLTVENNKLKYSFYINKFFIFSILNHLKAGATL